MIKLLIADDSALMRRQLIKLFEAQGGEFEIRAARNGAEVLELNREFAPDVITLDINMPEMDGLTALSVLMAERPTAVVMLSSLTDKGAMATLEALNLGAVDFILKPGGTISLSISEVEAEILAKVRSAAKARIRSAKGLTARLRSARANPQPPPKRAEKTVGPARRRSTVPGDPGVVLIGVSTGGPQTLEAILPRFPADFPWPILVAQHMPPSFTRPFAERMDSLCALSVSEIARPQPLEPGTILIAKGGADMILTRRSGRLYAMSRPENKDYLWHPSVELLGLSAQEHCDPARVIAVLLTGMGYDGAQAFTELRRGGARTIAEAESSAVVFGMPAELIARGGAVSILPVERIADQVMTWVERETRVK